MVDVGPPPLSYMFQSLTHSVEDQEYVILQNEAVVSVPSDLEPSEYAPFLCAGVTVFNSIRNMNIPSGATVAVQGLGGLGHLALQYADKMGYHVIALSTSGSKEQFAKDLGAKEYIDASKKGWGEALKEKGGLELIVSTAPNPTVAKELQVGLEAMGTLLLLGREFSFNQVSGEVLAD